MMALVLQSHVRDGQFDDQSGCAIGQRRLVDPHFLSDVRVFESVQQPFPSRLATSYGSVNRLDRGEFDPLAIVGLDMEFVIVHTGDSSR